MLGHTMLWTTFYFVLELANVYCTMLSNVRQYQVLEARPWSELCALDSPSDSLFLNYVLDCAIECQRRWYCDNFNYNSVSKICDIFFNQPKCYGPSSSCIHYQVILLLLKRLITWERLYYERIFVIVKLLIMLRWMISCLVTPSIGLCPVVGWAKVNLFNLVVEHWSSEC